jgi:hypothetical protein
MDPSTVAFIKGVVAFVLVAGTGMSALWLWLRERRRRPEIDSIVDALRDENAALQSEMAARMLELEERVDFVERRVVQAPKVDRLPQDRIPTPA